MTSCKLLLVTFALCVVAIQARSAAKTGKAELLVRLLDLLERQGSESPPPPASASSDWSYSSSSGSSDWSYSSSSVSSDSSYSSSSVSSDSSYSSSSGSSDSSYSSSSGSGSGSGYGSGSSEFPCGHGNYSIPESWICDGDNDCLDCSDEAGCATGCEVYVPEPDFPCGNGGSVPASYVCDGDNDCGDCSDEACDATCDADYDYEYTPDVPDFQCENGNMTYTTYMCDGDNDCGDCTDEPMSCESEQACVVGQWNTDDIMCANGNGPYPASWQCDGWNDCGDCSDEVCEENTVACEGTAEGDNFGSSGGYMRKRSDRVLSKTRKTSLARILAEKRVHTQSQHITEKRNTIKRNTVKRGGEGPVHKTGGNSLHKLVKKVLSKKTKHHK